MTRTEPFLLPVFFASLLHILVFMLLVSYADLGGDNNLLLQEDLSQKSIKARLAVLPAPARPRPTPQPKPRIQKKQVENTIAQDQKPVETRQDQLEQLIEQLDAPPQDSAREEVVEESPIKPQDDAKLSAEKRDEAFAYYKRNQDLVERNFNTGTAAQQKAFEGLVTRLKIYLDEEGRLLDVEIISGSGNSVFDIEAERAVRRIDKFIIPKDDSLRRRYFREITMEFKLR